MKIDFRLVPEQDPARSRTLLRAHLDRRGFTDVELSAKEGTRPHRGRVDDPLVRAAQAVAEEEIENILLANYWKARRATVALFRRYADQA